MSREATEHVAPGVLVVQCSRWCGARQRRRVKERGKPERLLEGRRTDRAMVVEVLAGAYRANQEIGILPTEIAAHTAK